MCSSDLIEDLNAKLTSNLTFEIPTDTLASFLQSLVSWQRIVDRYIEDAKETQMFGAVSEKTVEKKTRKSHRAAAKSRAVCSAKKRTPRPKARRKG